MLNLAIYGHPIWAAQPNVEPTSASEEKEKEDHSELTHLLTLFLDTTESMPGADCQAVSSTFLNAIYDKAGPIIASTSLLYNLIDGPWAHQLPGMTGQKATEGVLQQFKKDFYTNNRWLFDDPEHWILKEITKDLILLIPLSYIDEKNISIKEIDTRLGLKIGLASPITIDTIKQRYSNLSLSDWRALCTETGTTFVNALKNNLIFNQNTTDIKWVIYLNGHGEYLQSIGSITLEQFPDVLHFFDKQDSVALLVCNSCYAAGTNTAITYGELTTNCDQLNDELTTQHDQLHNKLNSKLNNELAFSANAPRSRPRTITAYSFPIVTTAITDAMTSAMLTQYKDKKLVFYHDFKKWIDHFTAHPDKPLEESLVYVMPEIKAYQDEKIPLIDKGNLPQIRYAHSPIWFPVIESTHSVTQITHTMALTRQKPLVLGTHTHMPKKTVGQAKKAVKEKQFIRAVLLHTDYVPFDIVIEKDTLPHFIVTMPYDTTLYLEKIIEKNPTDIASFSQRMGLDPLKPFYEGSKQLFLAELTIQPNDDLLSPPELYRDIIIDFKSNTMYFTDAHNQYWIIKNDTIPTPYPYDYHPQFKNLFSIAQKTKKNHQLKALAFQKLPHLMYQHLHKIKQHNIEQHDIKQHKIEHV